MVQGREHAGGIRKNRIQDLNLIYKNLQKSIKLTF
jgi:hypothetical protein